MATTGTNIIRTVPEETDGSGTHGVHNKGDVRDKKNDSQNESDASDSTAAVQNTLRWAKQSQNQSEYTDLHKRDVLSDELKVVNKNVVKHYEVPHSPWTILGVANDHRLWDDDEMSQKNKNHRNRYKSNEKDCKVNRSQEHNRQLTSQKKLDRSLKKVDHNSVSSHLSSFEDDCSLFEQQLQQLEKETTDKCYKLKFKSWKKRKEKLQKLDQNSVKKSKSSDKKYLCAEFISSKEKTISSSHLHKYHSEHDKIQFQKTKSYHYKDHHQNSSNNSLNQPSKEESAFISDLSVTSCDTCQSARIPNKVDGVDEPSCGKKHYELTQLKNDNVKHLQKTNEILESYYKRCYRLQHAQWKGSTKCTLRLLKRKYRSVRILFAKEPIVVVDNLDIDRYKMIGENFEVISMWETETDSSVCKENGDLEKEDPGDGVNLVDPRVMSLSRTLQSGQNGKVGAEKTFRNLSSKHTKAKTKVCFKLEAVKNSNSKKTVVQKPGWTALKQKLKEVNDKQILKKIKDGKAVGKELNKYSKSIKNPFQNKVKDHRKPFDKQESNNPETVDESVIQERKRELEKLCTKFQSDSEDVTSNQETDESSAFCDKLGEIQEMLSDSDVELDTDFKIDGYSIEICHHISDEERSKEPSVDREIISEERKSELLDGLNQGTNQSGLRVTSGIIPNLYVSDETRVLQVDDRSLSPPILVRECDDSTDIKKESPEEYRYMIKEEADAENESRNDMETGECEKKGKNSYSNENGCKVETKPDIQDGVKCPSDNTETNSDTIKIIFNSEALNHNTPNSGDNTQYLNSQSAFPEQGLNRHGSISPDHTSNHQSLLTLSTPITSDIVQSSMSSSLTDAVLSDSAETLNYSDLLDDEMRPRNMESDEAEDSDTDTEIVKIERELLSLPNYDMDLNKTDDAVRQWKTLSLSSSPSSSSDNENATSDRKSHNTQAKDKSYKSANSKYEVTSHDKRSSGNNIDEKIEISKVGTLRRNVQGLKCFKSKKEIKMEKQVKSVLRQSSESDVVDKFGKTSKKRKKSNDKNNPQDLEDLPKISPPKRRHRPYSVGSYRPIRDWTQERLMQDLPNHNWLFNKYSALSTDQKPMDAKNEQNEQNSLKVGKEQIDDSNSGQQLTKGDVNDVMAGQPLSRGRIVSQTFPEGGIDDKMTSQSLIKAETIDEKTGQPLTKGGTVETMSDKPLTKGDTFDLISNQQIIQENTVDIISDRQITKLGVNDTKTNHMLTEGGMFVTNSHPLIKGGIEDKVTGQIFTKNNMEDTMTGELLTQKEDAISISRSLNDESTSERQTNSQLFSVNQNTVGHFKMRLMDGKSKQDEINLHYGISSTKNTKNSSRDTIKYKTGKIDEAVINQTASRPVTTHQSSANEQVQNSEIQIDNVENSCLQSVGKMQVDSTSMETESVDQTNDPRDLIDLTNSHKSGFEPDIENCDLVIEENREDISVGEIASVTKKDKEERNVCHKGQDNKSITEKKINIGSEVEEMECTELVTYSKEKCSPIDAGSPKEQRFSEPAHSTAVSPSACSIKQQGTEDSSSLSVRQKPQPPVLRVQPHLYKPPCQTATRTESESSPFDSSRSLQLSSRDTERQSLASGNRLESSRTGSSDIANTLDIDQHHSNFTDQSQHPDVRVPVRLSSGLPSQSFTDASTVPSLLSSNSHSRNTNTGMVNPVQPFIQTTVLSHPRQTHVQSTHIPPSTTALTSSLRTTTTNTQLLIPRAVVPFNPTANVLLNQTNQSQVNRQEQALITVQNAPQVFEINPVTPLPSGNQVILLNNASSMIPINTITSRNTQSLGSKVLSSIQTQQEQQQFGQILSSSQIIIAQPLNTRISNNSVTMVESVPRVNTVNKISHTSSVNNQADRNSTVLTSRDDEGRDPSNNTQRSSGEGGSSSDDDEDFKRQMEEIENEIKRKQREQDEIRQKKLELLEKRKAAKSGVKVRIEEVSQNSIKDEQDDIAPHGNDNTCSVKRENIDPASVSGSDTHINETDNVQIERVAGENTFKSTGPNINSVTSNVQIERVAGDNIFKSTGPNTNSVTSNVQIEKVAGDNIFKSAGPNTNNVTNNVQIEKVTGDKVSHSIQPVIVSSVQVANKQEESQNDSRDSSMNHTLQKEIRESLTDTDNTDDEGDQFEGALVIDLSATSKEYTGSNMNGSQPSNSTSSQKSKTDQTKTEKETEIKPIEDKDNENKTSDETGNVSVSTIDDNGDMNENSIQYIQDIGRMNPFTGEYDHFDITDSTHESLDLTHKSNKTLKDSYTSNKEECEMASESNPERKQNETQIATSKSCEKVKEVTSSNYAELIENNNEDTVNNLDDKADSSNEIIDLTCSGDVNGLDLSAKPICVFTFKKEDDRNKENHTDLFVENTNDIVNNNIPNACQSKDIQNMNKTTQEKAINRTGCSDEESSVITSKEASAALAALNQNNIKQESISETDTEKQKESNSNEVMTDIQSMSSNGIFATSEALGPESKQRTTERGINLSKDVNSTVVLALDTGNSTVSTTERPVHIVTSGSLTVTSALIASATSVTSSVTLVTSPSTSNVMKRYREIRCKPQVTENAPSGTQGKLNSAHYPPLPYQQPITQDQLVSPPNRSRGQEHENSQRLGQRDHGMDIAGVLPFQCRPAAHVYENERRNEREGWWHPQLKVQHHAHRRTRGMFIELEPAHSQPRQKKIPKGAKPAPAHNQVVNMKEIFKKMNKSHCSVPLIIQQSCPYFRRRYPIHESPDYVLTDGKVKPDIKTIQQAHSQKPFSVAGHLIVSRKRALKRSASRATISPSPTRFASMPNTPPSPPERMKRSSSAMADIPFRQCDGSLESPLPSQRSNSLEPACPARAHTCIDDLDHKTFSTLQTLKPPTSFKVDERQSSDRSLDVIDLTRIESPKREIIDTQVVLLEMNKENEMQNELTVAMAKRQKLDNTVKVSTRKTPNSSGLNSINNRDRNSVHTQLPPPNPSLQNRMQTPVSRPPRSRQPDYSRPRQVLAPVPIDRPPISEVGSQRLLHEAMFSSNPHGSSPVNRSDHSQTDPLVRQSNYLARRMELAQRMSNRPNDWMTQSMDNNLNDHLTGRMHGQQGDHLTQTLGNKQRDTLFHSMKNRPLDHLTERLVNSPNTLLAQRMENRQSLNQRMVNRHGEFLAQRIEPRPSPENRMENRQNDQPFQSLDYRQSEQMVQMTDSRTHEQLATRMDNRQDNTFSQPSSYRQQPPKLIQPNGQQYQSHMSYAQQMSNNRAANQKPELVSREDQSFSNAVEIYPQGRQNVQRLSFHAPQTMTGNQGSIERSRHQHLHPESLGHQQHSNMSDRHNTISGFSQAMPGQQLNIQMESMQGQRQLSNLGQQNIQRPMMNTPTGVPLPNTRGDAAHTWAQIQKMQQIRANHIRNRQLQQNNQINREVQVRQGNPAVSQQSPHEQFEQGQVQWARYQHSPTQLQAVTQTSPTGHFQNIEQVLRHPSRYPGQHTQQVPGSHGNFPHTRAPDLTDIRHPQATKYYHLGPPEVQFITSINPMVSHQNQPLLNWSQAQMTRQAQMDAQMFNQGYQKQPVQVQPSRTTEGHPGVDMNIKMISPIQESPKSAYSPNICLTSQHRTTPQYQGYGGQGHMKGTPAQQQQTTVQPKQSGSPGQSIQIEEESLPHLQQVHGTCVLCGKYSLYLCSSCKKIWYCSPECQLTHWQTHANECQGPEG